MSVGELHKTSKFLVIDQLQDDENHITKITLINRELEKVNVLSLAMADLKENVTKEGGRRGMISVTETQAKEVDEFFFQKYLGDSPSNDDILIAGKTFGKAKTSDAGMGFLYNDNYYEYSIIEVAK